MARARNSHLTSNIVIKIADVDLEIIPIINWLNSFNGIITVFSCEGKEKGDKGWDKKNRGNINSVHRPYISFMVYSFFGDEHMEIIESLLSKYGGFDTIDELNNNKRVFRFESKPRMREFIKKELNKEIVLLSGVSTNREYK